MTVAHNNPKLRFPEFSQDWEETTLGEHFQFKNGVNADKTAYGKGRKFVNVLDIISDRPITYESIIGCVEISDEEFEKNAVTYGDILFQRSSETREEVGQSNVYLDTEKTATFGGFVIRGKPIAEHDPLFFHYLLCTARVRKDMTSRSGGSTRYNIGQDALAQVPAEIAPTLGEQQKVASFFKALDEKIDHLNRKQALLEDYKKGCMQQLFSKTVRFKNDHGQDFPDWERQPFGDIIDDIADGGTPSKANPDFFDGDIPWIVIDDIKPQIKKTKSTLTEQGLASSSAKLWPENTLILSTGATIGRVGIAGIPLATKQGICGIVPKEKTVTRWLYYLLQTLKPTLVSLAQGNTIKEVRAPTIKKIMVSLPHTDEQKKIANFLTTLDTKVQLVSEELAHVQTFKKGLLQQMFI